MTKENLANEIEKIFNEKHNCDYRLNIFSVMSEALSIADLKEILNYIKEEC